MPTLNGPPGPQRAKLRASRCGAGLIIPEGPGLTGAASIQPKAGAVILTVWPRAGQPRHLTFLTTAEALTAAAELLA